jgi:hypothetical protein
MPAGIPVAGTSYTLTCEIGNIQMFAMGHHNILLISATTHDTYCVTGATDADASLTKTRPVAMQQGLVLLRGTGQKRARVKAPGAQTRSSHRGRSHTLTPSRTGNPKVARPTAPTRTLSVFTDTCAPDPNLNLLILREWVRAQVPLPSAPAPRGLCDPASVSLCGKTTIAPTRCTGKKIALQHGKFLLITC